MDSGELLMAMERALEARRALKEFFKAPAEKTHDAQRTKSREAALLERVEKTRNDFEAKLNSYVDKRIDARLSQHEIGDHLPISSDK